MNLNEEIRNEIDKLDKLVNVRIDVHSPAFPQIAYNFCDLISDAGKLYSKAKANVESLKLDFESWEALTELNIRSHYENLNSANKLLDNSFKPERITEARITAEVKQDGQFKVKKQDIIEAERLLHLVDKAIFDVSKLRGLISQAIINNNMKGE